MVGYFDSAMRFLQTSPNSSVHYGVGADGRIGQGVSEKWAAWHAGNWGYNLRSIGIEHEDKTRCEKGAWMTDEMFQSSTKLAAHLCRKYDIPVSRIIPHNQVASDGRSCPGPYFKIDNYRSRVRKLLGDSAQPLPKITPVRPPAGSTRNWSPPALRVVNQIEANFPVICSTYPGHGRTGEAWGIDAWVAPFRFKANKTQEALGDSIQRWVERNWDRLSIDYVIWWDWMKENRGTPWFDYSPWSKPASQGGWPGGDPDPETRKHLDHFHLQILG